MKHWLSLLSKTFVFFLRTTSEYLTRYLLVVKKDPCKNLLEYSPKRKTRVLDIFNTDQKCFIQINIESNPQEI